jgi:hypothetical protein
MKLTDILILCTIFTVSFGKPDSVLAEHVGSKQQNVRCAWPEDCHILRKASQEKQIRTELPRKSGRLSSSAHDTALLQELIAPAASPPLPGRITQGKPDKAVPPPDEQGARALEKLLTD